MGDIGIINWKIPGKHKRKPEKERLDSQSICTVGDA